MVGQIEKIATREAYGNVLVKLGETNPAIVVLDADLSKSTITYKFAEKFPNRFFNCGIAEANMMCIAAGLANTGKIPFVSTFAVFATGRAWDHIRMSIAYSNMNVKIVATHSGISVGEDGASHQATEDIALMSAMPNMRVVVPADAIETEQAVTYATKIYGPIYIRLGRMKVPVINSAEYKFEFGKVVKFCEGKDLTIISCGIMVYNALEAAKMLLKENISARVVNIHTIKPIDRELIIDCAKYTKAILCVEEHNIIGGLGSIVSQVIAENYPIPMRFIALKDTFGESGSPEELLNKYGLTTDNIVKTAKELMKIKQMAIKRGIL